MAVTLGGNPITVAGTFPKVGDTAPGFTLVNKDMTDVSLADFSGKRKVLDIVVSLDTSICVDSARKFNAAAAALNNTVVLVISADLPFAQGRLCEGLDKVITLSTMRGWAFKKNYGVDIQSGKFAGLCARAVVVLDENNKVLHAELVPEIAQDPNFEAALAALK